MIVKRMPRYEVLDGWRGISILCVLAAHMLPLGPKKWALNATFGAIGMCIFFILSGFLIATTLIYRPSVRDFLIRRLFRILPLALLYLAIAFPLLGAPREAYLPNLLFFANWPPYWLKWGNGHFWSLDVEMQFYLGIALIFIIFRRLGLYLLPIFGLLVTANHVWHGDPLPMIDTYYRLDEILAGASLALVRERGAGCFLSTILERLSPYLMIPLLMASAHPATGYLNYFRPYFAALLVGATIYQNSSRLSSILMRRQLGYMAEISYALYVIHPLTMQGWLGEGNVLIRYLKRPLSFLLTFGFAYFSTYYYENRWINFGKILANYSSRSKGSGQ